MLTLTPIPVFPGSCREKLHCWHLLFTQLSWNPQACFLLQHLLEYHIRCSSLLPFLYHCVFVPYFIHPWASDLEARQGKWLEGWSYFLISGLLLIPVIHNTQYCGILSSSFLFVVADFQAVLLFSALASIATSTVPDTPKFWTLEGFPGVDKLTTSKFPLL